MNKAIKVNTKIEPSIEKLAVQLDFQPTKPELFIEAFTHSSFANEHSIPSNERLEFLGDSVLGVIVCQFLYESYPDYSEGNLAKLKSTMVSAPILASFSDELQLGSYIRLGQGERKSSNNKQNVMADLFEAFLGAYYLNFGLERTAGLIIPLLRRKLPEIIDRFNEVNAKTNLQEIVQAEGLKPVYRTIKEEGPPHNKTFTVEVLVNDCVLGVGSGRSIKEAQIRAALIALKKLKSYC